MPSTDALIYTRSYAVGASVSARPGTALLYYGSRLVSGAYSPEVKSTSSGKDAWLPQAQYPLGHVVINGQKYPVQVDIQSWYRFFSSIADRLGGFNGSRLPDVVTTVETAQTSAAESAQRTQAVAQQAAANAASLAAAREVIQAAGLPGASQIPPPVLDGGTAIP